MDHPDVIGELHRVDDAERTPRNGSAVSNTPGPMPRIGLTMSALPPSAAIVRAARQIDVAPSGNVSKSLKGCPDPGNGSCPWDHRLIARAVVSGLTLSYLTMPVNGLRDMHLMGPGRGDAPLCLVSRDRRMRGLTYAMTRRGGGRTARSRLQDHHYTGIM